MIARLFFIIACILFFAACKNKKKKPDCTGKDRWEVKTLTDERETEINYKALKTSIATLISVPPPGILESKTPRLGVEFYTFTLDCRISEYKVSDDGDYHLVLTDLNDPAKTMVAEIPDVACQSVAESKYAAKYVKAKEIFLKSLLPGGDADTCVYTITGVAFFDKVHGQLGAAPSAIELHPVLGISKK